METYDVVLLTEARYDKPTHTDLYIQNILTEDSLVKRALEMRGLRVTRVDWANPHFDWYSTRLALFRTTWDYFNRFTEFSVWLDSTAKKTQFLNPIELIRWNMDKHYLRDMQERGINVTPTVYIEVGETITLERLHEETGWTDTVLKPSVSGAGRHTYKLHKDNLLRHETLFQKLIAQEAMMLQPFQYNVVNSGELALMVVDGTYTHAVRKVAKEGDFRVQDDFGGTVHTHTPSKEEIAFVEHAVSVCKPSPVYARVDLITDNNDRLAVSELELIEPEMWFRFHPPASDRLAEAIVKNLEIRVKHAYGEVSAKNKFRN